MAFCLKKSLFFSIVVLIVTTQPAGGTIKVLNVLGASNVELPQDSADAGTTNNTVIVYGGTAGPVCTGSTDRDTCNNCNTVTGLVKCNTNRIYANLILRFEFQSDSKDGVPVLADKDGNIFGTSGPSGNRGSTVYAEARWSEVCTEIGDTGTVKCETQVADNIRVGIDENGNSTLDSGEDALTINIKVHDPGGDANGDPTTDFDTNKGCGASSPNNAGICDFTAFPGDNKVFIIDPVEAAGFPNSGNITFDRLRFYISETDFVCQPSESLEPADLNISGTASTSFELDNKVIDRLENGKLYYFRLATVDKANNVNNFMDDSVITAACGITYDCGGSRSVAGIDPNCPYIARPDEVLGLLTEDFNCFIATAAYGSPWDSRLSLLRKFRSEVLAQYDWGKRLINIYYKKGPYAAKWVVDHPWARPLLQFFLWPLWVFAWVSLNWGLSAAILLTVFSFGTPLLAFVLTRKWSVPSQQEKAFE